MDRTIIFSLSRWFSQEKRQLPWRVRKSPYRVWVSEVMLQQTRAEVVIPYFKRWMERFPTVDALAQATENEVIKLWEGLGYYSRARSLHAGSKQIMREFGGELPRSEEALLSIKGIGPYTAGAIRSFAFEEKAAAVDGNVKRVVSRLNASDDEIEKKTLDLLPDEQPWVIMEALIELGAMVCKPRPNCDICPMKEGCRALAQGKELDFPKKKKRVEVTELVREVAVILFGNEVLVQKNEGSKVMAGLYEFPYFEEGTAERLYPHGLESVRDLNEQKHTFTRFRARLTPTLWRAKMKKEIDGFTWVGVDALKGLPFSSGHKKILNNLLEVLL